MMWICRSGRLTLDDFSRLLTGMNETIDELSIGDLRLIQAEKGYRYSLDPVLLARFVQLRDDELVVDLGTGSGILLLLLAKLSAARELIGLELQPELANRAARNVELNFLADRVKVQQGDLRQIRDIFPAAETDLVISNPPYRKLGTGRVSPADERAAARHELAGGLPEFIAAAAWLLKNGGRLALIYLAERLPELMAEMEKRNIIPKRLRMIHPRLQEPAKMVLVEGRKAGRPGLQVEKPLIVYQGAGRDYSKEVLKFYGMA